MTDHPFAVGGTSPLRGEIISRSYEPPVGWRGILRELLPNALVFECDEGCSPSLPTLLPAFFLISPRFPDAPGAARVTWSAATEQGTPADESDAGSTPWLPAQLRARLRPGAALEHAVIDGVSIWRLEGIARLVESRQVARPRLVLAPPRRRDPQEVQRALVNSLRRALRSVPPENDLKRLVEVSQGFVSKLPHPAELADLSFLAELVGFGAGRTACGDDYLVGLVCGLDLSASTDLRIDPSRFHEFRAAFVGTLQRSFQQTTLLGRHVLLAAFHGLYSTPLLDEADALSDGIIIGPGEPEYSLVRRPTVSPGWPALLGLLTGASIVLRAPGLRRD